MQRVLIILVIALAVGLAAWLWQPKSISTESVTIAPPPPPVAAQSHAPTQKAVPVRDLKGEPIPPQDQAKAIAHIETITPPEKTPINVKNAQHFVTADQLLQLPIKQIQTDADLETVNALQSDNAGETVLQTLLPAPSAPASQNTIAEAATIDSRTAAAPTSTVTATVSEAPLTPANTITIEVPGTDGEPVSAAVVNAVPATSTPDTAIASAVTDAGLTIKPIGQTPATIAIQPTLMDPVAILPRAGSQIKLKELLDHPEHSDKQIYYLHAVRQNDDQGLWGIIQAALVDAFARGLELPGTAGQATADIPDDADERLRDLRSSFLGHILQRKVQETYIYNYAKGNLGQNPDLIQPGQQLIIVTFTEEELIQIYQFFANP